jgi:hypothetical protein
VQAVREHYGEAELAASGSPSAYAAQREHLKLAVLNAPAANANMTTRIVSESETEIPSDRLAYIDYQSQLVENKQAKLDNASTGEV